MRIMSVMLATTTHGGVDKERDADHAA